jgi:hypothetical protein
MQSVDGHRTRSITATFARDYTDDDLALATSGLATRGFSRSRLLRSRPPKLMVTIRDDASQEQIDEVSTFLSEIEHVEDVKIK